MTTKGDKLVPRLPRGFRDVFGEDVLARWEMVEKIRSVFERYGFEPLDTPAVEFARVLGKFIQEEDLPEEGIFSFKADQPDWLALRYDLTAPLSRIVAQYRQLPRPFRRYQFGPVWRVEKPGPGRFREFYQFDIDTVGSASMAADAEICCALCDALEALGLEVGSFVVRVNNRRILNGVLEAAGVDSRKDEGLTALRVMRCIDKLNRLGMEGVRALLAEGRLDQSGDFTEGAGLSQDELSVVSDYLQAAGQSRRAVCEALLSVVSSSQEGRRGIDELVQIDEFLSAAGYDEQRVVFDPTIVRGLTYYTGPVFEASLRVERAKGQFMDSVAGGGRYDDLVERFTGEKVPATGAAIGVDRLLEALKVLQIVKRSVRAPVLVTQMVPERAIEYQAMTFELRRAGVAAELYLGEGGIRKQLKYADERGIPVAVIAGPDEFASNSVSIKDLALGKRLAGVVSDRAEWLKREQTQVSVAREKLVEKVKELLARESAVE